MFTPPIYAAAVTAKTFLFAMILLMDCLPTICTVQNRTFSGQIGFYRAKRYMQFFADGLQGLTVFPHLVDFQFLVDCHKKTPPQ